MHKFCACLLILGIIPVHLNHKVLLKLAEYHQRRKIHNVHVTMNILTCSTVLIAIQIQTYIYSKNAFQCLHCTEIYFHPAQ